MEVELHATYPVKVHLFNLFHLHIQILNYSPQKVINRKLFFAFFSDSGLPSSQFQKICLISWKSAFTTAYYLLANIHELLMKNVPFHSRSCLTVFTPPHR